MESISEVAVLLSLIRLVVHVCDGVLMCSFSPNSATRDGLVGKLFNTRQGFLCHIARRRGNRDGSFYALVPQPCV